MYISNPSSGSLKQQRSYADRSSGAEEAAWPEQATGERAGPRRAAGHPTESREELRGGDDKVHSPFTMDSFFSDLGYSTIITFTIVKVLHCYYRNMYFLLNII